MMQPEKTPMAEITEQTLPNGFRYAGSACGIKASGKLDASLIIAEAPAVAAGVYTTNQVVAAPVVWSRSRTPTTTFRAVITNSGNANACTGERGERDNAEMAARVAEQLGCSVDDVLVMSTGVIGHPLPMEKVRKGIDDCVSGLAGTPQAFLAAADGILTTDVGRKVEMAQVTLGNQTYRIAAMAKGAGMIAPNMATMLSVVLTDAPLTSESAQQILVDTARKSFNRVSVDGHTSTNDTLLLISSGTDASKPLAGDDLREFQAEIETTCIRLSKLLVADGEGATHVMSIDVSGAANETDAEEIARTIAESPLVKTAITGGDPNWGRIVSAAGYARPRIEPEKTSLKICGVSIYEQGAPVDFDEASLSQTMKDSPEVSIDLVVGLGQGQAKYWASDLTVDYVRFNSEYTT